jgi:hypothetical protein
MESILETKASTILDFIRGLGGNLSVTFEEGTSAAWLYDLLKPHVAHLIVCDPRKNALLKVGNKNDRIDPQKLTDLLRAGLLSPVYHGESGVRTLQELARTYLTVTKDLTRVMNRLKGVYRSWAIPCAGQTVYAPRHRSAWLEKLVQAGVRRRAEQLYQQLDKLVEIGREARQELLRESRKHPARVSADPRLGYSGPFTSRCCGHRIVSVPSDSCGPTAGWPCRRGAAGIPLQRGTTAASKSRRRSAVRRESQSRSEVCQRARPRKPVARTILG